MLLGFNEKLKKVLYMKILWHVSCCMFNANYFMTYIWLLNTEENMEQLNLINQFIQCKIKKNSKEINFNEKLS